MAEEELPGPMEADDDAGPGPTRRDWWAELPPIDPQLEGLVFLAEVGGVSPSMTFLVGGAVVTGVMTSAGEWFAKHADNWEEGTTPVIEGLSGERRKLLEAIVRKTRIDSGLAAAWGEELMKGVRPSYVHLRNAHVVFGGAPMVPRGDGMQLRIRLDRIDGWSAEGLADAEV